MITQKNKKIYIQSVDKVNTLCYTMSENKVNTPLGGENMKILIRAPQELKEILQETSKKLGITLNALVLQILWEWVKNNQEAWR